MKLLLIPIALILFIVFGASAGKVEHTYRFNSPNSKEVGNYSAFHFENTLLSALPGQPVMPYKAINLLLPPGQKAVGIEIFCSDEILLDGSYMIYPQQNVQPISKGSSGIFSKDEAVYAQNSIYPNEPKGKLLTTFINGRSIAQSTFTPLRYIPSSGKVSYFRTVRVVITTEKDVQAQTALTNNRLSNSIAKLVDNPEANNQYTSNRASLTNDYELLIICTSTFSSSFGSYQSDYTKQGIRSKLSTYEFITNSTTGADNQDKIRNYIIQEYQTHGIKYVLLAGDDELIPHRGLYCTVQSGFGYTDQNIPADIYYSALDGNWNTDGDSFWGEPGEDDLLPEVAVARMPFSNQFELDAMLNKTHKYRFEPVAGEFNRILLAGENLYSNPETWGSDYLNLLIGTRSDNGYTTTGIPATQTYDSIYDEHSNWSGQDLMNHLNQGRPVLHHSGHANETYVMKLSNSDITNANFAGLNGVDHNYTLVYTHGCLCGAFDYNDCIAEKMVTINNFAAAFVGNSRYGWFNEGQTEGPSAHLHREFVDAMYTDSLYRIGEAHMESKKATSAWVTAPGQWEPGALRWCFYDCNVLGDPALAIYTDNPIPITTTYPANLVIGTPSININVVSNGTPIGGLTCVVLKNDTIIARAYTNSAGNAELVFEPSVLVPCDVQLVVSGYNCTPTIYNIAFAPSGGPYVVHAFSIINDPTGNQNNQPDYSETIVLTNAMRNAGNTDASDVNVILQSSDPYITLIDTTSFYAFIATGDTSTIINAYSFAIADNVPDQHEALFQLKAVSNETWVSDFNIICFAPQLSAGVLQIDDINGNNNHRLDQGESVTINIAAINNGSSASSNTTATLACSSSWINILNPTISIGNISAGAQSNAGYTVSVDPQAPTGEIIHFTFHVKAGAYEHTTEYYVPVGLIVEDFETGNFQAFPWAQFGMSPWSISQNSPWEGLYCSRSAKINHSQKSVMSINMYVPQDDSISFYAKVSSEESFDYLRFFIGLQKMGEWSGNLAWTKYAYPVLAGSNAFKWEYSKDPFNSVGDDAACVDFIVFPSYIDFTGQHENQKLQLSLQLSPNPASGILRAEFTSPESGFFTIMLLQNDGKLISTSEIKVNALLPEISNMDVSKLSAGMYTLIVKSTEYSISKAFIVN